jgi:hypothetical protein
VLPSVGVANVVIGFAKVIYPTPIPGFGWTTGGGASRSSRGMLTSV